MNQPETLLLQNKYTAYLVRVWCEGDQIVWRASAQSVHSGERRLFGNLHELFVFLESEVVRLTAAGTQDRIER